MVNGNAPFFKSISDPKVNGLNRSEWGGNVPISPILSRVGKQYISKDENVIAINVIPTRKLEPDFFLRTGYRSYCSRGGQRKIMNKIEECLKKYLSVHKECTEGGELCIRNQ